MTGPRLTAAVFSCVFPYTAPGPIPIVTKTIELDG